MSFSEITKENVLVARKRDCCLYEEFLNVSSENYWAKFEIKSDLQAINDFGREPPNVAS